MAKFNLNSLLSGTSLNNAESEEKGEKKSRKNHKVIPISVYDLVPSENNFYSMEQIEDLKTAIELAGGIKQNLTVTPLGNGKYKVLAGHRRRLASIALVEEGKTEYEFVPCGVETIEEDEELQEIREELLLILTNSQRDKTDWDKVEEVKRLRTILERYKKKEKLPGRVREIIAETLNTSAAQVGRMDSISKKLSEEFKEEFKEQKINISTAYELSILPEEAQQEVFEEYMENGSISINDVKEKRAEIKEESKEILEQKEKPEEEEESEEESEEEPEEEEKAEVKTDQKKEKIERLQSIPTMYEILKEMSVSELAEFICYRCDEVGRFCDFAIECNQSEKTDRHEICIKWLKMQAQKRR